MFPSLRDCCGKRVPVPVQHSITSRRVSRRHGVPLAQTALSYRSNWAGCHILLLLLLPVRIYLYRPVWAGCLPHTLLLRNCEVSLLPVVFGSQGTQSLLGSMESSVWIVLSLLPTFHDISSISENLKESRKERERTTEKPKSIKTSSYSKAGTGYLMTRRREGARKLTVESAPSRKRFPPSESLISNTLLRRG